MDMTTTLIVTIIRMITEYVWLSLLKLTVQLLYRELSDYNVHTSNSTQPSYRHTTLCYSTYKVDDEKLRRFIFSKT